MTTSGFVSASSVNTFSTNNWYHIALVYNLTNIKLFINGTLQINNTINPIVGNNGWTPQLLIGDQNGGGAPNPGFAGYMDELRITNATTRYTSNFTVPQREFSNN